MASKNTAKNKLNWERRIKNGLTSQDKEVIKLICQEKTSQEIADKIGKSKKTVDNCRLAIVQIIGCKNVVGVVLYALRKEIVKIKDL
jgi:DNA-binding CsgD family transcriptional regulator